MIVTIYSLIKVVIVCSSSRRDSFSQDSLPSNIHSSKVSNNKGFVEPMPSCNKVWHVLSAFITHCPSLVCGKINVVNIVFTVLYLLWPMMSYWRSEVRCWSWCSNSSSQQTMFTRQENRVNTESWSPGVSEEVRPGDSNGL